MRYSLSAAWLSHQGLVRRMNEDACLVAGIVSSGSSPFPALVAAPDGPWIVAVSDGIGGHRAGAEASSAVVEALSKCKRVSGAAIRDELCKTHRRLCDRGRRDPERAGMGATVAGIGCGARGLFAFSVGDSRVYRKGDEELVQVTRDDSEAEELIEMGLLSRQDDVRPGYLHALTQAIGGRLEYVDIEVHRHALEVNGPNRFLVCSDGLTDMVGRTEIQQVMTVPSAPKVAVEALFGLAMDAGGLDNITLVVMDVTPHSDSRRGSGRS